jgi:hypothetical protein
LLHSLSACEKTVTLPSVRLQVPSIVIPSKSQRRSGNDARRNEFERSPRFGFTIQSRLITHVSDPASNDGLTLALAMDPFVSFVKGPKNWAIEIKVIVFS